MEEPGRLQSMGFSRQEYWSGVPLPSPKKEATRLKGIFDKLWKMYNRYWPKAAAATLGSNTFIHKFTLFIRKFLIPQYIHIGNFELNITLPPRGDHWDLGLKKFLMMALRASLPACCLCSGINSPHGASGKEPACQCRRWKRHGLILVLRRSPGGGHGKPL